MASIGEEENAAELEFGREFSGQGKENEVQCLSNDEVYFLLSKKVVAGNNEYVLISIDLLLYLLFVC